MFGNATGTNAAADPTVTADDDTDSYRGVGAVLLSRAWSGAASERRSSATCGGCRWSFRSSCRTHGMGCSSGSWPSCPPGTARFDMLRSDSASDPLRYRGTACLGPGGPVTTVGKFTWRRPGLGADISTGPIASHMWLHPGSVRVHVSAMWTASFSVDDLGPFPVEQTITQRGSMNLRVHRTQKVLVPSQPQG